MLKPICKPCQRFFRMVKSGFYFIEGMPTISRNPTPGTAHPEDWRPYKLWAGDLWKCQGCGAEIISGTGSNPIAEHYQEDFGKQRERLAANYQVNDC